MSKLSGILLAIAIAISLFIGIDYSFARLGQRQAGTAVHPDYIRKNCYVVLGNNGVLYHCGMAPLLFKLTSPGVRVDYAPETGLITGRVYGYVITFVNR